jgi:excisionase family DNA binding protein
MTDVAPAPNKPKLYTTQQIAEIFQVTPETVRDWIVKGKLKGGKAPGNNQYRVAYADLITFAKSHYNLNL